MFEQQLNAYLKAAAPALPCAAARAAFAGYVRCAAREVCGEGPEADFTIAAAQLGDGPEEAARDFVESQPPETLARWHTAANRRRLGLRCAAGLALAALAALVLLLAADKGAVLGSGSIGSTDTEALTVEEQAKAALDALAAEKFAQYQPAPGSAVAFEQGGIWYVVCPKVRIESREQAMTEYPDKVIPARLSLFTFAGFSPYDTGFSGANSYAVSELADQNADMREGLIPLPDSCGRTQYGVRYETPEGGLLILTVEEGKTLAEDNTAIPQQVAGRTFYQKTNQPYTLGLQVEGGSALWLHSVFPVAGVAYTEDDPRAELSQEELQALLIEVSGQFS